MSESTRERFIRILSIDPVDADRPFIFSSVFIIMSVERELAAVVFINFARTANAGAYIMSHGRAMRNSVRE